MDPVASKQKQTSIKPKAGIGMSSLKLGFNFVALMLLLLSVFMTPVTGGRTGAIGGIARTAGLGTGIFLAGFEATAFLIGLANLLILLGFAATIFLA